MDEPTGGPIAGLHYPSDLAQLRAWFPTDTACLDYLDWLRWPQGFTCPNCGGSASGVDAVGRYRCRGCRRQVSVISHTIFHKTRTPMSVWFEAVWDVVAPKTGVSAAHLYRVLPIHSYQTAWTMLAKIRQVMAQAEARPLSGRVEVDEAFFGGPRPGARGRGANGKTMVAGAVELPERGFGRARMCVIPDARTDTLKQFITTHVAPGAQVITDGLNSYPGALEGYSHQPVNIAASGRAAHESLPAVHRVFSQAQRMIEGTYQGAGSSEHLQEYLDEYVFRFNRRSSRHRGLLFLRLLQRAVATRPVIYKDLIRLPTPKPSPPTGVPGPHRKPGSLNITPTYHPWRDAPTPW